MRRIWLFWGVAALLFVMGGCSSQKPLVTAVPPEEMEADIEEEENIDPRYRADQRVVKEVLQENHYRKRGKKPTVLLVHKESRKLTVFRGTTPLKTYPVVLGRNPRNDKLRQGDMCTPEGIYKVVCKFPHAKWNKFILLNYPTTKNWLKFAEAKKRGKIPITADIGGEIGIHGTEDDLKNLTGENWTLGCVSLRNKHLDEIYPLIEDGSLVVIQRK